VEDSLKMAQNNDSEIIEQFKNGFEVSIVVVEQPTYGFMQLDTSIRKTTQKDPISWVWKRILD